MAGRPALFDTVEDLENLISDYFIHIQGDFEWKCKTNLDGEEEDYKQYTRDAENPSITGLALYLGFESRQSVYDYEKKNDLFSYTIKRARLRVEAFYEQALLSRASTGAIFGLKNFGWSDRQEIDHTTKGQSLNGKDLSKLTDEELRTMDAIEKKLNA